MTFNEHGVPMKPKPPEIVLLKSGPPIGAVLVATFVAICFLFASQVFGQAGYKTENFSVSAATPELAKQIGDHAEWYRVEAAKYWLGKELPTWSSCCPINARVSPQLGAGGSTSFRLDSGEVLGFRMQIQGSHERVLDSVLPHEITHTILYSHFRQPLPRWLDEGACTTIEHETEVAKYERNLVAYLKAGRGLRFSEMLLMREYPADTNALYAQGHSVCTWLIEKHGREQFIAFIADGLRDDNWPRAVRDCYGYETPLAMQHDWNDWVRAGRPQLAYANKGQCGNGYCYPQSYGPTVRQSRPQTPQELRPIPSPATPTVTTPPVTTAPPVPPPGCDCKDKWTELAEWRVKIEAALKRGETLIAEQQTQINNHSAAIAEYEQGFSVAVNQLIATYLAENPVEVPQAQPQDKPSTLNFIDTDGEIIATATIAPGASSDVSLPPINFRIQDPRPGYSTIYQPAELGRYVTLPFGPAK